MKNLITLNNCDYEHVETFNTYEEMYNTLVVNRGYNDYISWLDDFDSTDQDRLLYDKVDSHVTDLVLIYERMREKKSFNEDLYHLMVSQIIETINNDIDISWWHLIIKEDL